MFRGGRVSSYGTGIAAPLVPGYQSGGQIGGGIIYGRPMADGRYGFQDSLLFDVKDAIGETETGSEVVETAKEKVTTPDIFTGVPKTQEYMEEKKEWEIYEPEFEGMEDLDVAYEKEIEKQQSIADSLAIDNWGASVGEMKGSQQEVGEIYKDLEYLKTEEGKKWFFQKKKKEQDEKIKEAKKYDVHKTTEFDTAPIKELTADQLKINELEALIAQREKDAIGEASTEIDQDEIFKMLGGEKAKGRDISSMLMSASSKLLGEGATVKSAFGEFLGEEAKRPSEQQRLKEAAGMLAVKDKLETRKSERNIAQILGLEGAKIGMKAKAENLKNLDWQTRKLTIAKLIGASGPKSSEVIRQSLMYEPIAEGKNITVTQDEKVISNPDNFEVGLYILDAGDKGKRVIEIKEINGIKQVDILDQFII
jgi:hypothetical protein